MEPEELRSSYDAVAEDYARKFIDELSRKPFDRALLEEFARECPRGRVLDLGCGPGHVGRFLSELGVEVTGVDLAPSMIKVARRLNEGVRFEVGDMRQLRYGDGEIAGIVAFYSLIHIARDRVPPVLRNFHRVMARGGKLLIAVHGGSDTITADEFLEHPVRFEATLFEAEELEVLLAAAGFRVDRTLQRDRYEFETHTPRLYLAATRT